MPDPITAGVFALNTIAFGYVLRKYLARNKIQDKVLSEVRGDSDTRIEEIEDEDMGQLKEYLIEEK